MTDRPTSTGGDRERGPGLGFRPSAGQVAAILLAILALVFAIENTRKVKIRFIVPEVTSPLWVALLITLLVGMAAGWLLRHRR